MFARSIRTISLVTRNIRSIYTEEYVAKPLPSLETLESFRKQFIIRMIKKPIVPVSKDVEIAPSKLSGAKFYQGTEDGIIAKSDIKMGTIFKPVCSSTDKNLLLKLNDGLINLEPIIYAKSSVLMERVLMNMFANYCDIDKAKEKLNVQLIQSGNEMYGYALKDIGAGEELLRGYGSCEWLGEEGVIYSLNYHNLCGYFHALSNVFDHIEHYYQRNAAALMITAKQLLKLQPFIVGLTARHDERIDFSSSANYDRTFEANYWNDISIGERFYDLLNLNPLFRRFRM